MRYVDGLSPEQVARELTVSPRQASRDLQEALRELTLLLWARRPGELPSAPDPGASADLQHVVHGVLGTLKRLLGSTGERKLSVRVSLPDTLPPLTVEPDLTLVGSIQGAEQMQKGAFSRS